VQRLSPPTPRTPNILVMLFQMLNITLPVFDRHPSVKFLDVPMSLASSGASDAGALSQMLRDFLGIANLKLEVSTRCFAQPIEEAPPSDVFDEGTGAGVDAAGDEQKRTDSSSEKEHDAPQHSDRGKRHRTPSPTAAPPGEEVFGAGDQSGAEQQQ